MNGVERLEEKSTFPACHGGADWTIFHVPTHISMDSKQVIYRGEVQGVGFRYAVAHEAMHFDVKGEVQNLPDGAVEVKVTGDEEEIDEFLEAIREGRYKENIEEEIVTEIPALHHKAGFRIH